MTWETWIDRQIRQGMEDGEFDDLPGTGRPIAGLDSPRDELWWVRDKLRREKVSWLPPTLAVRRELDETLDKVAAAATEDEVRALVTAINRRIREVNVTATAGPPSSVAPLDVEREVERWRRGRADR